MSPASSVLIVDDEPAVRDLMSRWVGSLGLEPTTAANADEALASLRSRHHDLAVIDVMMPGKDGLWLAAELRRDYPHTAVIIATAHTELLEGAPLQTPVADFLIKPFKRERFVLAVDRGRRWRRQAEAELEWHARLSGEMRDKVKGVCAAIDQVRTAGEDEADALWALAAERMPAIAAHSDRVVRFSTAIARELGTDPALVPSIEQAARFHDIGKVAMPEPLLTKPSPLTPGEVAIMRQHIDAGTAILEATQALHEVAPLVRASHEWFGGGGYPARLKGSAIPLASRIVATADAYDTMTQDRPDRRRLDSAEAISELLRCSPNQFDPDVVVAFLTVLGRH